MGDSDEAEEKKTPGSFTQTGRLGEVFQESLEVVKIAVFNLLHEMDQVRDFDKNSYHLHVPMGATPKDGPSAGTSLFTALVSSAINRPVAANLAMTGEITTLGEVISIGGVREKLTACKTHIQKRHGVVIPKGQGPKVFFAKNYPKTQKTSPHGSEQEMPHGSEQEMPHGSEQELIE